MEYVKPVMYVSSFMSDALCGGIVLFISFEAPANNDKWLKTSNTHINIALFLLFLAATPYGVMRDLCSC